MTISENNKNSLFPFFLAKISRMVPHLLVNDSIFVISFCYGVMAQAIRSEMDKLVIEQCSYIILNLARYELTKANVFQVSFRII